MKTSIKTRIQNIFRNLTPLLSFIAIFAVATPSSIVPLLVKASPATTVPGITITKLFDGVAPFDAVAGNGNDTSNNNNIVRAGQITAFKFTLSLNDPLAGTPTPYNNFTFTSSPLPIGFRWQALPLFCSGPGSAITGDGKLTPSILTCNTGTKNTGDVFTVSASVFTMPTVINNTPLFYSATASVSGSTNTALANAPVVTATVLPKIDVQKSGSYFAGSRTVDGVPGYIFFNGLGIKLKPGSESPALPMTLTDDISSISPNAKFLGCGVSGSLSPVTNAWYYGINMPLGKLGQPSNWQTASNDPAQSVVDSGTINCTPRTADPKTIDISIDNVNTNPASYPSKVFAVSYADVSPGDNWIGSYYTLIWFPATEFNSGNNFNFSGTNKYNDFNPTGLISGAPNYNDVTLEPGRGLTNAQTASDTSLTGTEDWYTQVYYRPPPGNFEKYDYKFSEGAVTMVGDTSINANNAGDIGTASKSGDAVLGNNSVYTSMADLNVYGVVDIPAGFTNCMTIDTNNVSVDPYTNEPTRAAHVWSENPSLLNQYSNIKVEYGTGGTGGAGTGWASRADQKSGKCNDSDSAVWYSNIQNVPGGIDKITKIRSVVQNTFTVAEQTEMVALSPYGAAYMRLWVKLKVKSNATPGNIAPNYQTVKDPSSAWFGTTANQWFEPTYDYTTGLGSLGDRITIVGTRVRVAKTISDPITESASGLAGSTKSFFLSPTSDALGLNPAGQSVNVKIVDTLPVGLNYSIGTSVCLDALPAIQPTSCEPGLTVNSNGTTTLTWEYGTFTAGTAMAKVKFDTTLDSTLANGASLINSAVISADNDNSLLAWRTDTATAIVVNPSAFAVQKKVVTPFVPIGNSVTYKLIEKNTGSDTVDTTDFIDWLPWNGDLRTPASNIDGQMKFTSLTNTGGISTSQIRYTKHDRTTLSLPDDLDPNTINPSIVWCAALSGGLCPANNDEVTGFRFETGPMTSGQGIELTLVLTPSPTALDKTGNIITNRFKGRAEGLTLPVESNNVYATVVSGTIGDTIYWDKSGNGLQDTGERGIPGVTVELIELISGDPVDCDLINPGIQGCIAVTDLYGKYLFKDLLFKNYKVKVTQPSGYTQTGDPDSTINNETILTVSNTSPATRSNLTGDFGYKGNASFGDKVWEDRNGNGIQDTNELPIQNAEVTLLFAGFDGIFGNADDVIIGNVNTDSNGNYLFTDLPAGNYRATLNTASVPGLTPTTPTVINQTLAVNQAYTAGDFGLQYNTVIGDTVYYDVNGSGAQNAGEPGIPGVTVTLKDANGNDIDSDLSTSGIQPTTTITDANGKYKFEHLPFGTYKPVVTPLTGYVQTGDPDGSLDNSTALTTSSTNTSNLGGDFGFQGTASFGDRVWVDQNNNQTQDSGETTNVPGAKVTLVFAGFDGIFGNADDVTYPLATTDINGEYTFGDLPPGLYKSTLDMATIPGAVQTTPLTVQQNLTTGQAFLNGDFGVKFTGGIGDKIYFDINGDGIQNGTEPGIPGVTVTLKDGSGNDIDSDPATPGVQPTTTVTDANGQYTFIDLPFGTYTVLISQPSSFPTQTGDPDSIKDNKSTVILTSTNKVNLAQDFGYRGTASIGDKVWYDVDGDGVQDANEVGVAGATVSIKWAGPDGILGNADDLIIGTTTTDANGNYIFANLPAGNYSITIDPASVLGSVTTTPTTVNQTLTNGQTVTTVDFGIRGTGTIGNLVWKDFDKDGLKDSGEPGLAGAVVNLYQDLNGNGIIDTGEPLIQTATTDTNGVYSFTNLLTEDNSATNGMGVKYIVTAPSTAGSVLLGSLAPTNLGTANTNDNNQNAAGYSATLSPTIISNTTADFGFLGNASFGDKVWFDVDGDGVQDAGEPGVQGALITLIEAGPDGIFGNADDIVIGTTTTDVNGNYIFDKLIPGKYRATISPSSVNGSTATTPLTIDKTLSVGEVYQGGDFGLRGNGTIGNLLWIDTNIDGIAQATESGLANIKVELYDDLNGDGIIQPNEPKIATVLTDSTGKYEFTNLLTEDNNAINGVGFKYIVKVDQTTLPTNTPASILGTPGVDNNNQNQNGTPVVLSNTTTTVTSVDFGYIGQPGIKLDKTIYAGHTAGAGCPGGDELLIVDKTRAQKDVTYCFTVSNTGSTYLNNLTINDPELSITQANMTLLSGTFPLAPGATAVWYYQTTTNTSLDNTATVTGIPTNSAGVPTTQTVVTDTDLLAKLIYVFDPPIGIKTGTYLGSNIIRWTMTWINTAQVTANGAIVSDPIPEKTTYNGNLVCTGAGVTTVTSCIYESPSVQYPRGRVLVVSNIGSDVGGTTAENSANKLQITFDVLAAPDAGDVSNQARLSWEGFDEPSQAPNTGGPTKVIIPKGIENLLRTGGYAISQNSDMFIAIGMFALAGTLSISAIKKRKYLK
jgi:uncharacterized repeat protein (TIGR01451 family)